MLLGGQNGRVVPPVESIGDEGKFKDGIALGLSGVGCRLRNAASKPTFVLYAASVMLFGLVSSCGDSPGSLDGILAGSRRLGTAPCGGINNLNCDFYATKNTAHPYLLKCKCKSENTSTTGPTSTTTTSTTSSSTTTTVATTSSTTTTSTTTTPSIPKVDLSCFPRMTNAVPVEGGFAVGIEYVVANGAASGIQKSNEFKVTYCNAGGSPVTVGAPVLAVGQQQHLLTAQLAMSSATFVVACMATAAPNNEEQNSDNNCQSITVTCEPKAGAANCSPVGPSLRPLGFCSICDF